MDLLLLSPWTFVEQASYRNPNLRELVIIMDVERWKHQISAKNLLVLISENITRFSYAASCESIILSARPYPIASFACMYLGRWMSLAISSFGFPVPFANSSM